MATLAGARPRRIARVRIPERAALPIGIVALGGLIACAAVLCMAAAAARSGLIPASWHGLPGWMAGPLPGIGRGLTSHAYTPLFLAMCGCYLVALLVARRLSARLVIGAIVVLHALFMLAPPLLSADVFGYIDWARLGAVHGIAPYSHGSLSATHDPVFEFMRWRTHMGSPYGPLFTIASYAVAPLGVAASLWTFKVATALAGLIIVWLTWACARRLGRDPLPAVALFGLNPLVLVWAVGGTHNDLFPVAVTMGAVYLALSQRERAAGAAALCAAAIKVSSGVLLPFLVAGARRRRDALAGAGIALALTAVASLAVFGTGVSGFVTSNERQQHLVANASVPNQIGKWLGFGGITAGLRTLAAVALVAAVVWLLVRTWRGADWIGAAGWATLALLVSSAWLMPWYVVWLLPLAGLTRNRRLTLASLAFCAYVVAVRTPI